MMRSFLGVLWLLALVGCARHPTLRPPVVAEPKPLSFQVKRYLEEGAYSVASDRGSVVLLDVWATWCEPCRDALPLYEQLAREYGPRGLKVYALNVDEDARAIPGFLAETKVSVPVLVDEDAQVAERILGVRVMPTTYIVDRQGVVRFVHEGFSGGLRQRYQAEIEQLLAEPAP